MDHIGDGSAINSYCIEHQSLTVHQNVQMVPSLQIMFSQPTQSCRNLRGLHHRHPTPPQNHRKTKTLSWTHSLTGSTSSSLALSLPAVTSSLPILTLPGPILTLSPPTFIVLLPTYGLTLSMPVLTLSLPALTLSAPILIVSLPTLTLSLPVLTLLWPILTPSLPTLIV